MDGRYSSVLARFQCQINAGQVVVHRAYSSDALQQFPDQYFDWVYVDGNHLYEYVAKDLELCFIKVRVDGYIAGDDYTDGGWWEGGVKKAVDEFAERPTVRLLETRNQQFIFRKLSHPARAGG
jgi:hypothetical protein